MALPDLLARYGAADLAELVPRLGATLPTLDLADLSELSPDSWWAVARGEHPSPIDGLTALRVGRAVRWPAQPVLQALGLYGQPRQDPTPTPHAGAPQALTLRVIVELPDGTQTETVVTPDAGRSRDHHSSGTVTIPGGRSETAKPQRKATPPGPTGGTA